MKILEVAGNIIITTVITLVIFGVISVLVSTNPIIRLLVFVSLVIIYYGMMICCYEKYCKVNKNKVRFHIKGHHKSSRKRNK